MTPKAQSIKATTGKLRLINIKKTSALRKTLKKIKTQATTGTCILIHINDKGLVL